jgi:hypothetical protein
MPDRTLTVGCVVVALGVLLLLGLLVVVALVLPAVTAIRQRQRVEAEVRIAQWRIRHAAQQAIQQMLDEARRTTHGPGI